MNAQSIPAESLQDQLEDSPTEIAETDLPEGYRVEVSLGKDHELGQSEAGGVRFQKCGGGRRIIRKRLS